MWFQRSFFVMQATSLLGVSLTWVAQVGFSAAVAVGAVHSASTTPAQTPMTHEARRRELSCRDTRPIPSCGVGRTHEGDVSPGAGETSVSSRPSLAVVVGRRRFRRRAREATPAGGRRTGFFARHFSTSRAAACARPGSVRGRGREPRTATPQPKVLVPGGGGLSGASHARDPGSRRYRGAGYRCTEGARAVNT